MVIVRAHSVRGPFAGLTGALPDRIAALRALRTDAGASTERLQVARRVYGYKVRTLMASHASHARLA